MNAETPCPDCSCPEWAHGRDYCWTRHTAEDGSATLCPCPRNSELRDAKGMALRERIATVEGRPNARLAAHRAANKEVIA